VTRRPSDAGISSPKPAAAVAMALFESAVKATLL
jgi:hypothetical protein